jgi:tRNA U34 5-methylaminomethyl-2-thiouridine-forming methyltransferase MnmC
MKIQKAADGFDTLFSEQYNQTYHSIHGVLQESQHVFLDGAGVETRLKNKKETSILEIGFGTGFNFFLTASKAIENEASLNFTSIENNFLDYNLFSRLNHNQLPNIKKLYDKFLSWRKNQPQNPQPGIYKIDFTNNSKPYQIQLNLVIGNAVEVSLPVHKYDAVYLDAFSPDDNPELWTVSFLKKLFLAMNPGAMLSTYSAKGNVRRAMTKAGFEVSKRPGSLGKREMLAARKGW